MEMPTHAAWQEEQEMNEQITAELRKLGIEQAIQGTPICKLAEILALKPTEKLEKIADDLLGDPRPTEREALIARLHEVLIDPEKINGQLLSLDVTCWRLFQQVLEKAEFQDDEDILRYFIFPRHPMLIQSFYDQERFILIVPDEIRAAYESLLPGGLLEERDFMEQVDQYASASAQYYGAISVDDFVSLFNGYHRRKLTADDALDILDTCGRGETHYALYGDLIAHPSFEDAEYGDIEALTEQAGRYPRHIPRKSEFLRHADLAYVSETPQLTTLRRFLTELAAPDRKEAAEELAEHAAIMFSTDWEYSAAVAGLLNDTPWLKNIESEIKRKTFLRLTRDLFENTRNWALNGNTRKELREMGLLGDAGDENKAEENSAPVGRNALCPCGSGKKYKKCCGRDA